MRKRTMKQVLKRAAAVSVLAMWAGVAIAVGAERRHFGGDGIPDYFRMRLWKDDGELKCAFMDREMDFEEAVGIWRKFAEKGRTNAAVMWGIAGGVTMQEASEKLGALVALGFRDQFYLVPGAKEGQVFIFNLEDVWDAEEVELEELPEEGENE